MTKADNNPIRNQSHGGMVSWAHSRLSRVLREAGRFVLDTVVPPLCLNCKSEVSEPQSLCARCWGQVRFLGPPHCVQCGMPFPHDLGAQVKCGVCLARPPFFEWMRSAVAYDDGSRDLILGFKHGDRLETVPLFGRWMHQAMLNDTQNGELIVPVPLHWRRLFKRRYNQSALLAHRLGKLVDVPVRSGLLVRTKATPSQGEMGTARSRLKNVAGAFALSEEGKRIVKGKRLVLVDDVLTTGATANACSKALLRGGALSVSVVTLARVVRPLNFAG